MHDIAVLFDLDGVLIDTEGIYYEFWDAIERIYPTGIPDYANAIKGSTLAKIMNNYPDPTVKADIVRRLERQEEEMRYIVFDHVCEFLDSLHERHIPCAIVTSSNDDKLGKLFDQNPGFKDYFDVIITDSRVTRSKPDPQGYLLAAEALGYRPEDCVVFEDSFSGLEAGRRSGATVIGVASTNSPESIAPFCDKVITGFDAIDIPTLLTLTASHHVTMA